MPKIATSIGHLDATMVDDVKATIRLVERHVARTELEIAELLRNRNRVKLAPENGANYLR